MGWKDAPAVEQQPASAAQPKWSSAPALDDAPVESVRGDYRDQYAGQSTARGNLSYAKDYALGIGRAMLKPRAPDMSTQQPLIGVGETAAHLGTAALSPLFALPDYAITKAGLTDPRNPSGTYAGAREKYVYQPRSAVGQYGADVSGAVLKPAGDLFSLIGSGYGDIAGQLGASPRAQNEIRDMAPDVVGAGLAVGALRPPRSVAPVRPVPPTTAELGTQASAAYRRAEDAGIVVTPQSFDAMKMQLLDQMEKAGIDPTLHPDATAAVKRIASTEGPVTLEKLETLRRIASDAEGSVKPADARLAGELVDQIDDFVEQLGEKDVAAGNPAQAAALKEARGLYSRKKKAQTIDSLIARAELSASGMDAGLRAEFRTLAKNEKRIRRFTQEEQQAIREVAKGGGLTEKALRLFGKLSSGPLGLGVGGGLGWAAGGPIGAAVIPPAAFAARLGASRMTMRNAQAAQELMRRGPQQQASAVQPSAGNASPGAANLSDEAARKQVAMMLLLQSMREAQGKQ